MKRETLIFAAVASVLWIGCAPAKPPKTGPPRAEPVPVNPALKPFLERYDSSYDPNHEMLLSEFRSPGYHSKISTGTPVHPTRESLIYALGLLQRDAAGDIDRAAGIVRKVLSLQDTNSASPTYGVWPWLLEEPLGEMDSPDLNWADFCAAQIAQMLAEHFDALPDELQASMRQSLRHAVRAIRKRNVGPGYTNIAVMGGGVCAVAGELFDDSGLLEYGQRRLQGVVEHTAHHGGFSEYNSPTYAEVVIGECERTLQLVRDPATREAAESLRRTAWQMIADSFHPGTQQWAGPHSRTSRFRLGASIAGFLTRRTGVPIQPHPADVDDLKPNRYAIVGPLPCPEKLIAKFHTPPAKPRQLRRTFLRAKPDVNSIVGTTWLSADACLGSVNRSSFWTQRKPLIGYWKTDEDPAIVFRLRFLHDGKDFASMGVRTAQEGPRVLSVFVPMRNRGDWHRSLDRPADGLFPATDFRVRFELLGSGVDTQSLGNGRYELSAGGHRIVVHTRPAHFAGEEVEWKLGRGGRSVYLDGICHHGKRRTFDFRTRLDVDIAAGIELLRAAETISEQPPTLIGRSSGGKQLVWDVPGHKRLSLRTQAE